MKFIGILVASALIFSDVAVGRPSRLAQRVAARAARRTNPKISSETLVSNSTHAEFSTNWSGAVLVSPPSGQKFTSAVGTFNVPSLSGSGAASAWVGIDGDTAQNAILQAGVDFQISGGRQTFTAWTEWFPNFAVDVSGFAVAEGNQIRVTVTSTSTTSGTAKLENLTSGKSTTISLRAPSSSAALQGQNAEWIVEDFEQGGSLVKLANFAPVTFTGASASTGSQSVGLSGATVIDMEQNNVVLTSVTIESSSSVQISHT